MKRKKDGKNSETVFLNVKKYTNRQGTQSGRT